MEENKRFEKLTSDEQERTTGAQDEMKHWVSGPAADRPNDCPFCHGFLEKAYPMFVCPRCDYTYYCTD